MRRLRLVLGFLVVYALAYQFLARLTARPGAEPAAVGGAALEALVADGTLSDHPGLFQTPLPGGRARCDLCPRNCELSDGVRGRCGVRANVGGSIRLLAYGLAASIAIDPVEKKPEYHFLPGTRILSFATAGCNLSCTFCQNWELSQNLPETVGGERATPGQLVEAALASGCRSIAYTYSEPVVFYEYMLDTAKLAHARGLANVMVTALYANPAPLEALAPYLDAATVDVKAFDDDFYRDYCGGGAKEPVLEGLRILKRHKVHLEIVKLIIPGLNDADATCRGLFEWVAKELGPETPLHLLRFFPNYCVRDLPPTPLIRLAEVKAMAEACGLKHVYVGNTGDPAEGTTRCAGCGEPLLVRAGMRLVESRLGPGGRCPGCGKRLEGVFE